MKKYQAGFGVVAIVGIVVIVSLVVSTGLYVWNRQHKKSPVSNQVGQKTEQPAAKTNDTTQQTEPAKNTETSHDGNYEYPPFVSSFSIKEWGIKFKVPAELSKLQYKVISNTELGFTFEGWSDIWANCAATQNGIGHLYRSNNSTDTDPNTGVTIKEASIATVNGYYYTFRGGEACSEDPQIRSEITQKQPTANLSNALANTLSAL